MEERLKSVFKTSQLRLILKALVFAGLLLWVKFSGFGILPVLAFWVLNLAMYYREPEHGKTELFYSFAILLIVSIFGVSLLSHFEFLLAAVAVFSFIFYLSLGIKGLVFVRRAEWNRIKDFLLLYSIFIGYFLSDKYDWFYAKYLFVFIAAFFIASEFISWMDIGFPKRQRLAALVFAFLILQLLWAVSILPIGFINSATLMLAFSYLILNFSVSHFAGSINKNLIVKNSIILFFALVAILFLADWKV